MIKKTDINLSAIISLRSFLILLIFLSPIMTAEALDPPHFKEGERYCDNCHIEANQPNVPALCTACHNSLGVASTKPFKNTDQVEIGVKGTSHRFDSEGLKYVKMRIKNGGTGFVKVTPGSVYRGNFDTQNEMEYEYEIFTSGPVGVASFNYRCRIRSKSDVDTYGPWAYELDDWSGWSEPTVTNSVVVLNDICGLGTNPGVTLTFENGASGTSFVKGATGRLYIKLLNRPDNLSMRTRTQDILVPGVKSINCAVCHNQHFNEKDRPFLRIKNRKNSLCKHCHSDRDKGAYVQLSGTSTNGGLLYLEDSSQNWNVDQWVGKQVYFQKNFGGIQPIEKQEAGQTEYDGFYRTIIANEKTIIQWDASNPVGQPIVSGFGYKIVDPNNIGSHPLGVPYKSMDMEHRFFPTTGNLVLDDNETPDDPKDDTVQCMTCHSPHYAHTQNAVGGEVISGTPSSLKVDTTYEKWTPLVNDELVGQELRIFNEFKRWKSKSGTTSNGTTVSFTDDSQNWEIDSFIGGKAEVAGELRTIVSNTTNTLIWSGDKPLSTPVQAGEPYTFYYISQVSEYGISSSGTKTGLTAQRAGIAIKGLATSGDLTSLTDISQNRTVNSLQGAKIELFNLRQQSLGLRTITSNTEDTIFWTGDLTENVVKGSEYHLHFWEDNTLAGAKVEIFDYQNRRIALRYITSNNKDTFNWSDPLDVTVEQKFRYQLYIQGGAERGFATEGSLFTLTDTLQNWDVNGLLDGEIVITLKRERPLSDTCPKTINETSFNVDYTKYKVCWDQSLSTHTDFGDVYFIYDSAGNLLSRGTAVDGGLKYLLDTSNDFRTLDRNGAVIRMYQRNERLITSNIKDTISWKKNRPAEADHPLEFNTGDEYYIRYRNRNWRRKRIITSNTANTITWSSFNPLEATVNAGDIFEVVDIMQALEERTITSNTKDTITWGVPLDIPIETGNVYFFNHNTTDEKAGSASSGTALTLTDISQTWPVNFWAGKKVKIDRRGQGFILDRANNESLCMTCHKYQSHFGQGSLGQENKNCRDCHTPHNTTNRFLIREVINNRRVMIRPGDNYVRADRKGICQVCHTQALHWRNNATEPEPHYANGCPQCHNHSDPERAWNYRCGRCHGKPPVPSGTKVDSKGNIVGSDGKIDNFMDNDGRRIDPIGQVTEYTTKSEAITPTVKKWGETFEYKVEDYAGGGGAHLVHVTGKGFLCDKCHGHTGYGEKHGGSVGRKIVKRKNVTFDFQLDYSLNQHNKGQPVTQIGYQGTELTETPVYPVIIQGDEEREAGTSSVYANRPDVTGGYGPGPIDLGDGGFSNEAFRPVCDPQTESFCDDGNDVKNPARCRVGCHNPRRLYLQNEPIQDMKNIFQWTWFFPMEGCLEDPGCDENSDNLPRDEVPDVPCPLCHDAQGLLIQGTFDKEITYDPYPAGSNPQKMVSSHPVDHTIRDDCKVCHDYYNKTSVHTQGKVYLRDKDGLSSHLWDETNTKSIELFCLSCHDADGATTEKNPLSPFSVERRADPNILVPDIKVYWDQSVHTNNANLTCFGDGSRTGCHGNPHGSANPSLLARYNQDAENDRYFCFNCHGYGLNYSSTNPNELRAIYAPAIRDQIEKKMHGGSGHPVPAPGEPWKHRRTESTITNERHAECIDCHDPMSDNKTNRLLGQRYLDITGTPWDPGKDRVAGDHPMAGDVQLTEQPDGTIQYTYWNDPQNRPGQPPHNPDETYYVRQPYVYEVCFRCHGPNYATFFKDYSPFPDVAPDRVGKKGHFSDKRKEFDPRSNHYADFPNGNLGANTAYHPVASPGRNATQALYLQLKDAFNLKSADDLKSLTMVCTDCHNNDALSNLRGPATFSNKRVTDVTPKIVSGWNNYSWDNPQQTGLAVADYQRQSNLRIGPHGSTNFRMLRADYNVNVYQNKNDRGDYMTARQGFALCFICHDEKVLLNTNRNNPMGTNFGRGNGNGWWIGNLHSEHLSSQSHIDAPNIGYSGSDGGGAVCHECHQNVHSNVEAQNTIYGDGMGGMLPPDGEDGILDGVSSTHLLNFGPQALGATALKPRWYYDGQYYRCNLYCHGANMQYCFYKHGQAGTISSWCESD